MTIPFVVLAVAALLPYVWSPFSLPERRALGGPDFQNPRQQNARLEGLGSRAMGAHANAFEALSVFAPAVVLAHLAGADALWSAVLSGGWLLARVAHGAFYVGDRQVPRTIAFIIALGCALGLFALAALA